MPTRRLATDISPCNTANTTRNRSSTGTVRPDIDPVAVANGIVTICLSLLRSVVQIGSDVTVTYAEDVATVFAAALDPVSRPQG